MDQVVQNTYLSLFRAALWQSEPSVPDKVDIDALIHIAIRQSSAPLIFDMLLRQTTVNISPQYRLLMKQVSLQQMQSHMHQMTILRNAMDALHADGFHPVVLKGFGLAALYPNPALRPSADIDLYVGTERFPEACESILRIYPDAYRPEKMIYAGKHYNIEVGDIVIETHRVSYTFSDHRRNRIYRSIEDLGLKGSTCIAKYDELEFHIPTPAFNALFVFLHAWHHFESGGMNFRQLADWMMVLHHYANQIDNDQLLSQLKQLHMLEAWQVFGWVLVNKLGLPNEDMPFYSDAFHKKGETVYTTLWNDILHGRVRTVTKDKTAKGWAKYWNTLRLIMQNAQWMYPVLPRTALREARIHMFASFEHILFKKDYE